MKTKILLYNIYNFHMTESRKNVKTKKQLFIMFKVLSIEFYRFFQLLNFDFGVLKKTLFT